MSLQDLPPKKKSLCLPLYQFNPVKKVLRISEHFHLQVFLYETFLYVVFQSSTRGAFQNCHTNISDRALHHECLHSALSPPLNFGRCFN